MSFFPFPYTNITSLIGWGGYVNDITGGALGLFFLIGLALVAFASTTPFGFRRSSLFTSFLIFIMAVLLRSMNWLSDLWVLVSMGGLLFLLAALWLKKE